MFKHAGGIFNKKNDMNLLLCGSSVSVVSLNEHWLNKDNVKMLIVVLTILWVPISVGKMVVNVARSLLVKNSLECIEMS